MKSVKKIEDEIIEYEKSCGDVFKDLGIEKAKRNFILGGITRVLKSIIGKRDGN